MLRFATKRWKIEYDLVVIDNDGARQITRLCRNSARDREKEHSKEQKSMNQEGKEQPSEGSIAVVQVR